MAKMKAVYNTDRRWQFRYLVKGSAVLDTGEESYTAVPVKLGLGGIVLKCDKTPPVNTAGVLCLKVQGFNETIFTNVRIIRARGKTASGIFVMPQPPLARCISWLAKSFQK